MQPHKKIIFYPQIFAFKNGAIVMVRYKMRWGIAPRQCSVDMKTEEYDLYTAITR